MAALLAERGLRDLSFAVVAMYPPDRVVERVVDGRGCRPPEGQRLCRRAARGGARHAAGGRRRDGLSPHERRGCRRGSCGIRRCHRVRQRRARVRRRCAASARLRQQRTRARRVRACTTRHHARRSDPQDDVASRRALSSSEPRERSRLGTPPTSWSSTLRDVADTATFERRTPIQQASPTCWSTACRSSTAETRRMRVRGRCWRGRSSIAVVERLRAVTNRHDDHEVAKLTKKPTSLSS